MSTKAHLEEEVRELRAVMRTAEVAHNLAISHLRGSPAHSADRIAAMLEEVENEASDVRTTWQRQLKPKHAPALAQKKPRPARAGTFLGNDWHFTRHDGLAVSQSITEVCDTCQCRVALLSAERTSGGFYDVRADFDGFKHDCERRHAGKGGE